MTALIFAQTLFYLTVSLAIIVLSVLLGVVAYHFIAIAKHLRKLSTDLDQASDDVRKNIEEIVEQLSSLPLFSLLFKKGDNRKEARKGRK